MKDLTDQEKKAINAYRRGRTKKQALLDAGYSESVANTDAHSVFNKPQVRAEIEARQKLAERRSKVDEMWIIQRLAQIADANVGELLVIDGNGTPNIDWDKLSPEMKYAMSGFKVRKYMKGRGKNAKPVTEITPQMADKLRALEMLARYLGMFQDKLKIEGEADLIEALHAGRARVAGNVEGPNDEPEDR